MSSPGEGDGIDVLEKADQLIQRLAEASRQNSSALCVKDDDEEKTAVSAPPSSIHIKDIGYEHDHRTVTTFASQLSDRSLDDNDESRFRAPTVTSYQHASGEQHGQLLADAQSMADSANADGMIEELQLQARLAAENTQRMQEALYQHQMDRGGGEDEAKALSVRQVEDGIASCIRSILQCWDSLSDGSAEYRGRYQQVPAMRGAFDNVPVRGPGYYGSYGGVRSERNDPRMGSIDGRGSENDGLLKSDGAEEYKRIGDNPKQ